MQTEWRKYSSKFLKNLRDNLLEDFDTITNW